MLSVAARCFTSGIRIKSWKILWEKVMIYYGSSDWLVDKHIKYHHFKYLFKIGSEEYVEREGEWTLFRIKSSWATQRDHLRENRIARVSFILHLFDIIILKLFYQRAIASGYKRAARDDLYCWVLKLEATSIKSPTIFLIGHHEFSDESQPANWPMENKKLHKSDEN